MLCTHACFFSLSGILYSGQSLKLPITHFQLGRVCPSHGSYMALIISLLIPLFLKRNKCCLYISHLCMLLFSNLTMCLLLHLFNVNRSCFDTIHASQLQLHICLCLFVISFKFLGLFSLKAVSLMITLPLEFLAPAKLPLARLLIMSLCNFTYKHWSKSLVTGIFFPSTPLNSIVSLEHGDLTTSGWALIHLCKYSSALSSSLQNNFLLFFPDHSPSSTSLCSYFMYFLHMIIFCTQQILTCH